MLRIWGIGVGEDVGIRATLFRGVIGGYRVLCGVSRVNGQEYVSY